MKNLRTGLKILSESGICSGCKAEIAESPEEDRCQIRQCCSSKGFDLCNQCTDFPCETLKSNPGVIKFSCIENLKEINERGVKAWVDKQWAEFTKE